VPQTSVYVSVPVAVGVTVWLPLVASVPLQLPEAVQLVAFVETQVKVAVLPTTIEVAEADREAVGVATTRLTVVAAEEPAPFAHCSV
jgi:hypothetical protein